MRLRAARRYTARASPPEGIDRMSTRTLILVVLLMLAAGCGQKGPLYLPDDDADTATD